MADVIDGRKAVTTAGTREVLGTSQECEKLVVQAAAANTQPVTIGGSTVVHSAATRRGITLTPGTMSPVFETIDIADVWVDVQVNGEVVHYIASTD